MSAEIIIMNTRGIALAADSAVTLGTGKIYNSADKLFALSKCRPVGIMIYGALNIMDIPWELIIKCYRDFLGNKPFDKLSEYAGDFINYLAKFPYFTDESKLEYFKSVCWEVFSNVLSEFINVICVDFDNKKKIPLSQIDARLTKCLKDLKGIIKKTDDEKQIKLDTEFIESNIDTVKAALKDVFENYQLSEKQITDLIDILKMNLQKSGWIRNHLTGIVIAGYGEREIFPVVYEIKVSGSIGDSLIYFDIDEDHIGIGSTDLNSSILPYAQTEMVQQFARGIDLDFQARISDDVSTILNLLSLTTNDLGEEKAIAISELLSERMLYTSDTLFKDPILDVVKDMQPAELTSMAEAMVNLTALRRHVSTDEESVGGPVDVALITKGEGFIWIKQKTSYNPHLNSHLNQSYFRGGNNENL